MKKDYRQIAGQYEDDVLTGVVPACEWVKKAIRRNQQDAKRWAEDGPFFYSEEEGNRVCQFVETLHHTKGALANTTIVLEPWQVWLLHTIFGWRRRSDEGRRFRRVYIEVPRGNGKALALDTLIPTPDGFVKMGDLKVGDYVYGSDGTPCCITAATEVMTGRPCYEVEFSTGEVIVADAEHQWVTDARRDRDRLKGRGGKHAGPKPSIKTTREIAETLYCRKERNHRIKVVPSVSGKEQAFELEPYMLGLWLGDGTSNSSGFTCADEETIERIRSLGYSVHKLANRPYSWAITTGSKGVNADKNSFYKKLQRLSLLGNKHIPDAYMNASAEQRLELLQGLMDTDGTISKGQGQCGFCQKSAALARQVYQLVASLGMRPTLNKRRAACNGKDCGFVFEVAFHAYADKPVFKLSRKVERLRERPVKASLQGYRQIVRCEPVESVPVRCIEVDSPDHCYLASEGHIITHNSSLSSGVALYCLLCDREPGAEVYSFATTRDQAKIVFNDAKRMCEVNAPLKKTFGVDVLANAIAVPGTNSTFQAKSAEGSTLDGLNTHFACIDELHAHKTRAVYDVVETSMGKRDNSLLWIITTAGFNLAGICYEIRTLVTKVLDEVFEDDAQFGVIYSIDPDDVWWTEEAARKANPNWGVSVKPDIVMGMLRKAKELPSAANNIKTKHLNLWCNAGVAWIDMQKWDACGDESLDISMFEHQPCYIGLDLASKCDVTAKVLIFPQTTATGERKFYMFPTFYLPQDAVERATNSQYAGWVEEGWIQQTDGGVTDFARVEDDLREDMERFDVKAIGYDPWNAAQLAADLDKEFAPMVEIRQYGQKASDDAKWFEAFILSGQLVQNANPCMTWMVSNAVAKGGEMLKIVKDTAENKIDGVDAACMAVGLCAVEEGNEEAFNDFMNNIIVV